MACVVSSSKINATKFWKLVDKNGACWLWCGGMRRGYPIFDDRSAARVAWELTFGDVPRGRHVRRRCASRTCVRPDHLIADASTHVRRPVFALSAMQAEDIRARRAAGETVVELAQLYGVSVQHVGAIVRQASWSGRPRGPRPGSVDIVRVETDADDTAWDVLACGHGRVRSTPWPNKWRHCPTCSP